MSRLIIVLTFGVVMTAIAGSAVSADDPLAPWRSGVRVRAVSPEESRHTVHSYFNTCPKSPDGKRVLFFSSTTRDAPGVTDERLRSPVLLNHTGGPKPPPVAPARDAIGRTRLR